MTWLSGWKRTENDVGKEIALLDTVVKEVLSD